MFDVRDAQGYKTGISVPVPSAPIHTHDALPQTPPDYRGDYRNDDDRHQDHGMYSGDEY